MSSNSIKSYQTCSIHPLEEEKNVCTNLRCLTAKDVKLICFDCFENHVQQKGNNQHKKIHNSKFLEQCSLKQKQYQIIQDKSIAQIQQFKETVIEQLDKILENFQYLIETLRKQFKGILEQELAICQKNQQQATEAMSDEQNASNFQNFIYFYILDEKNLEKQINQHNKDLQLKIQYYVNELELIHKEFCKYEFDSQIYQQMDSFEIKITPIPSQEIKIDQCDIHKVECNYMCTDALCSIQKLQKPHCIMCIHNEHQKLAQEHTIKQIFDVQAEQEQKINRITQQKEKTKSDLQKQLEEVIKDIENKQNTANDKFHKMKIRALEIYEEIIVKYINKIDPVEYLIGDIDKQLLQKSIQEIDDDAQNWIVYFGKKIKEIHQPEEEYQIQIDSIQNQQDQFQQQLQAQKSFNQTLRREKQELEGKIRSDQVSRLEQTIKTELSSHHNKLIKTINEQDSDNKETIIRELQEMKQNHGQVLAQIKQDVKQIKDNQKPFQPFLSFPQPPVNQKQSPPPFDQSQGIISTQPILQPPFPSLNQEQQTNSFASTRSTNPTKNS